MAYPELKEKTEKRLDTSSLSLNHFLWHFVCLDIQDFSTVLRSLHESCGILFFVAPWTSAVFKKITSYQ